MDSPHLSGVMDMFEFLDRVFGLAGSALSREPWAGLALGTAMVALFVRLVLRGGGDEGAGGAGGSGGCPGSGPEGPGLGGRVVGVVGVVGRLVWAMFVVCVVLAALGVLRQAFDQAEAEFRHRYGRVTEANLSAVRTIWGDEQAQVELGVGLSYEVEEEERLESEDPTRPALIRKNKKRVAISDNPFVSARHEVTLTSSLRSKGSAVYPGYETVCRFVYELRNPSEHAAEAVMRFPLPSGRAVIDDLKVVMDETDVRDRVRVDGSHLVIEREAEPGRTWRLAVSYRSRGLFSWYFQVRDRREIRDFVLRLTAADLPVSQWNIPEGCMTPTSLEATADGSGTVAEYRLDRAIVGKGMGLALPRATQPGEAEARVLRQAQKGWLWMFGLVLLGVVVVRESGPEGPGLRSGGERHFRGRVRGWGWGWGWVSALGMAAAVACGYGMAAGLYETVLGFWGWMAITVGLSLLAVWVVLRWTLAGAAAGRTAVVLTCGSALFAAAYPLASGLDPDHAEAYLHGAAALYLLMAGWLAIGAAGSRHEEAHAH